MLGLLGGVGIGVNAQPSTVLATPFWEHLTIKDVSLIAMFLINAGMLWERNRAGLAEVTTLKAELHGHYLHRDVLDERFRSIQGTLQEIRDRIDRLDRRAFPKWDGSTERRKS